MTLENPIASIGASVLDDKGKVKFRNERRKFTEFIETILRVFPESVSNDGVLVEPFRSLAFLVTVGQRPITSLLILEILREAKRRPLNGKQIGETLAKKLGILPALTTKGGNYEDRVGDLVSAFVKIGILETVALQKADHPKQEGFRIKKSVMPEVRTLLNSIALKRNVLRGLRPANIKDLFSARFDERLGYVIKSGTRKKQPFSIGKIVKSLLNPKLNVSFEEAIAIVEEIEPQLNTGMRTTQIQSILYETLKRHNEKAAESYRQSYPKILSITMTSGKTKTVNYKLVKTLIDKEAKLKLTRNLLDKFASIVYSVISKNPKNYRDETAIREYINALVRSECWHVRSTGSFIREHLESATSALDGCRSSLESDQIDPARGLLGQFLEQISLVAVVEFGYVPFKDFGQNIDLMSNLLRQEEIRKELHAEFKLNEDDLSHFQRIRFLVQGKETAAKKSLEKMVEECERLNALCKVVFETSSLRTKPQPVAAEILETIPLSQVNTGFEDLDNLLPGGIPDNYAVILTSPSCDEKDLLIERFLKTGIEANQVTLYVTIDAKAVVDFAEKFPLNFYLFICNPEADAIVGNLPNVFKLKGVENLTDIDIALTSVFRKLDAMPTRSRRACIEIVSDALLQHRAVSTRRWLAALIPKFKSKSFTTLAVMNPHMHSPQEVQALLDLFQGEIHIYKKKTEKGLRRFLRIERMYNQEYLQTELPLKKERMQK
ncbi:MAG: hypothetical protein JSV87_02610 [Candidatus Bathyarchaeota archaeon]|nr:MAG: hypothetical protein JSV87_02610 [Candidatus Bathyarchaeota archaeon]